MSDLWRLETREPAASEPEYGQGTRFKWRRLSDAPMPLWGHAAASYGNRMYVHGGTNITLAEHVLNNNDAGHLLAVLMYYDAEADRWQVRGASFRCFEARGGVAVPGSHDGVRIMGRAWWCAILSG